MLKPRKFETLVDPPEESKTEQQLRKDDVRTEQWLEKMGRKKEVKLWEDGCYSWENYQELEDMGRGLDLNTTHDSS